MELGIPKESLGCSPLSFLWANWPQSSSAETFPPTSLAPAGQNLALHGVRSRKDALLPFPFSQTCIYMGFVPKGSRISLWPKSKLPFCSHFYQELNIFPQLFLTLEVVTKLKLF